MGQRRDGLITFVLARYIFYHIFVQQCHPRAIVEGRVVAIFSIEFK
jgi:hypothetical protein